MRFTKLFTGFLIMMTSLEAAAQVAVTSPAANSAITAKSKIKGSCVGSSSVELSGQGVAKGKKISCQDKKFWEYSLSNIFKDMPNGVITITAKQNGKSGSRQFVKGSVVVVPPIVVEPPIIEPTVKKHCQIGTITIAHSRSMNFYKEAKVAAGQTCEAQVRECNDGKLSGSYVNAICEITVIEPPVETTDLNPNFHPGQNFNLSLWKLTLPVDASGKMGGTAVEIKPLTETYEHDQYFFTANDGAMVFTAPVLGATTSGSKYPRSELREMTKSYQNAAWTIDQGGVLKAELKVNEVPKNAAGQPGRVVIGQIHGPDDELNRLYYENGQLSFADDKAGSAQVETKFYLKSAAGAATNIPLNAKFSYQILIKDGIQTVTAIHNGVTYTASEKISAFWPGKALYFKAGVYVQVGKPGSGAGTIGTGQGQVSFYKLETPGH